MVKKRVLLVILDGWGYREETNGNAVKLAKTPAFDRLWREYPHTLIQASGEYVGLPEGLMGNSEVGHLNLGAGRIVYQDIVRISKAIDSGEFFQNKALLDAVKAAKGEATLHLMGLLSPGGVHSLQKHLYAIIRMAKEQEVERVRIHAILDGRDTPPRSGLSFLRELKQHLALNHIGCVATVMGRYYCMDRDNRWDRVKRAYDAMTLGEGNRTRDYLDALKESYNRDVTDEFVEPIVVVDESGEPLGRIKDGDAIIFFNFRADRAREITRAFTEQGFDEFEEKLRPNVHFTCMTEYDKRFPLPVVFPPETRAHILAEIMGDAGLTNLRIAETEKYAHVTFFFNGGVEKEYPGESRILIPSPKVATYDLQPEMSAPQVASTLIENLKKNEFDFILCNFANPDMVGHTGVLEAAIKAIEAVDGELGQIMDAVDIEKTTVIITADHGNAEQMIDANDGGPHTAHSTNPVPCILVDSHYQGNLIDDGSLRDIAPTVCHYLGIVPAPEMTGKDIRKK